MQLARDQLLSSAALAFDEDREIGECHPLDTTAERLHHIAAANEGCGPINVAGRRRHAHAGRLKYKPCQLCRSGE